MSEIEALYTDSVDRRIRSYNDDAEAMAGLAYPATFGRHYVRAAWTTIGRLFGSQSS